MGKRFLHHGRIDNHALPIGIPDPVSDDFFIRQVVRMSQVKQLSNEARTYRRSATLRLEWLRGDPLNHLLVNQRRQLDQRMTLIQMRHQRVAEQLAELQHFRLWTHKNLGNICKKVNGNILYSCKYGNHFYPSE
jgi:hypothetical protein